MAGFFYAIVYVESTLGRGLFNGRYEQEAWLKQTKTGWCGHRTVVLRQSWGKNPICLSGAVTGNTFLIELRNWLYIIHHIYNGFYGHSKCITICSSCFWLHSQTHIMLPDASWWHINELGPSLTPEPYSSSSSQKVSARIFHWPSSVFCQ